MSIDTSQPKKAIKDSESLFVLLFLFSSFFFICIKFGEKLSAEVIATVFGGITTAIVSVVHSFFKDKTADKMADRHHEQILKTGDSVSNE